MPRRSKVAQLPEEVRKDLDRRLIASGFCGYVALSELLAEQGYSIGKSALAVHGSQLERRIEYLRLSTEQAQALVAAAPDETGALTEASLRQVQALMFDLLMASETDDPKELASIARAMSETARASTAIQAERRKARAEAAADANKIMRKRGISDDTAAAIRAAIEGAPE